MRQTWAITTCMTRRVQHSWVALVLVVGATAQAALFFYLSPLQQETDMAGVRDFILNLNFIITTLLVIVGGSTEIPHEIERGTLLFVLAKPVRRHQVFLGKLLGLCLLGVFAVILQSALGTLVLYSRGVNPGLPYMLETLFLIIRILIIAAATTLFSVWFCEFATLFLCAFYLAISIHLDLLDYFIRLFPASLEMRLALRSGYYAFPNLTHLTVMSASETMPAPGILCAAALYGCAYFILLAALGCWCFQNRNFPRL